MIYEFKLVLLAVFLFGSVPTQVWQAYVAAAQVAQRWF
jgi:hypothetical protein